MGYYDQRSGEWVMEPGDDMLPPANDFTGANQWARNTGGTYQLGSDGKVYATPAPHGILDRIGQYAPYGIMATMAYGGLSDLGLLGGAGASAPAGASSGAATAPAAAGLLPAGGAVPAGVVAGGVPSTVAAATSGGGLATGGGMGFLSTLGNSIKNKFLSDPLGSIQGAGNVLGDASKGAAEGRREDSRAQVGAQQVNLNTQKLNDQRAMLASLLGGLQDAHISRPEGSTIPEFGITGGLRPSAMTNKDALIQQLGRQIAPLELPKPGMGEKIMGGVSLGTNILGQLGNIVKKPAASYGTPPYV
jgi:hypothetical protein